MAYYNIVTQSNESTVVAEYTASPVRSDAYQSESDLEREFIALLKTQGYEYLPIHTEADLIANLRKQLEVLNGIQFTDDEWKRFFSVHIANAKESIAEKTRKIQEGDSRINFKRDDGLTKKYSADRQSGHSRQQAASHQPIRKQCRHLQKPLRRYRACQRSPSRTYRTQTPRRGDTGSIQPDQPLSARQFLGGMRFV